MNEIRVLIVLGLSHIIVGCASIHQFYRDVPYGDVKVNDYEGEPQIEQAFDANLDDLILRRAADDYLLVGRADFTAPSHLDQTGAMIRQGSSIKAEKIDYVSFYIGTETGTSFMPMPTTQTSTGIVWSGMGAHTVTMTTTGTSIVPYNYSVARSEYHVFYFKKMSAPTRFGAWLDVPKDDLAKKIGTRDAMLVIAVVYGKLAWKNDIFKGDVILEIGGRPPTLDLLRNIGTPEVGNKIKIWRDGVVVDKEIAEGR